MNDHKHLILVGGGHSQLAVIKRLGLHPISGIKVSLISRDIQTPYSGMLPGLIAGHYRFSDAHIDLKALCTWANIELIHDSVITIDAEDQTLKTQQGNHFNYDWLSINIGSKPCLNSIDNATQYGIPVKPIDSFLDNWQRIVDQIKQTTEPFTITVVGGGAASVEVVLAVHYQLAKNNHHKLVRFRLICGKDLLSTHNKKVQEHFKRILTQREIELITHCKITEATENSLVTSDGGCFNTDAIILALHAGSQPWLAQSPITTTDDGFICVNDHLQSLSHPNIFAAGDIIDFKTQPLAKSGVYAVREGEILAENIYRCISQPQGDRQRITLKTFSAQKKFLSLMMTGDKHAIASKGRFSVAGKWVWYWKNHIDKQFMKRHQL